jgi:hypothetical protein
MIIGVLMIWVTAAIFVVALNVGGWTWVAFGWCLLSCASLLAITRSIDA